MSIPPGLIARAEALSTATLHEALGKRGALPPAIKPLVPGMRLCGPAFTVRTPPGDNLMLHQALYAAAPGDVLVVRVEPEQPAGYWGEIMAVAAQARALAGLIIDATVRDADPIDALGFPVFCRGLCIRGTGKRGGGELRGALDFDDVSVAHGDLMLGDRDGVVAVPAAEAAAAVADGEQRESREAEIMQQLRAGASTLELFGLPRQ